MSIVGAISSREERPPLVRYERRPVEDKAASIESGRYVARDVDYALVTPPYSKDEIPMKVEQWFEHLSRNISNNRCPAAWMDYFKRHYEAWRSGQEMPLNGFPIKGWGVISPAQQEMLVRINIMTVEDLAAVNDEGMRRIGIGAMELKNKAAAWLKSMNDSGKLVQENAALHVQVSNLRKEVETLKEMLEKAVTARQASSADVEADADEDSIGADDILSEQERPAKRRRHS